MKSLSLKKIKSLLQDKLIDLDFNKKLFTNKSFEEILKLDTLLKDSLFINLMEDNNDYLNFHIIINKNIINTKEVKNPVKLFFLQLLNIMYYKKSLILFPNNDYILTIRETFTLLNPECNISMVLYIQKELKEKGLLLISNNELFLDGEINILVRNISNDLIVINEGSYIVNGLIVSRN